MIRTFKRGGVRKRRSVRPTRKVSKGGVHVKKGGRVTFPLEYFSGKSLPISNNKIIVIKGGKRRYSARRSSKRSKRR
jgi:hypothetical protein